MINLWSVVYLVGLLVELCGGIYTHNQHQSQNDLNGIRASVWEFPSGLPRGSQDWLATKGNTFWANDSYWSQYNQVHENDAKMLKMSLGNSSAATAIVFFPIYLADESYWGPKPLQRLNQVVSDFSNSSISCILFFGDPEFQGRATWANTFDVVRNMTARTYLKNNIARTLSQPAVHRNVNHVSLYWLGASQRCNGKTMTCTEQMIEAYNQDIKSVVNNVGKRFLVHVDGPFWNGCWPSPCPDWNVAGYSPKSLTPESCDGIMAESWLMGSLEGGVKTLLQAKSITADSLLLLNDIPNCDLEPSHPCSSGSVESDTKQWFALAASLNITAWGVWDLIDGGVGDPNYYGDVLNDGSALTTKGKLHAAAATQYL